MSKTLSSTPSAKYQRQRRLLIKQGLQPHHIWIRPEAVRRYHAEYMRQYRAKVKAMKLGTTP